jgi:hypothetical protein
LDPFDRIYAVRGRKMLTALVGHLTRKWHEILRELTDPYRPELHYMRGPGPKWREKHPEE